MTTDQKAPESIIRKIQLLLQMAERKTTHDGASNENEASLAMAKAQELLAMYNLEMAVVNSTRVAGGTVAQQPEKRERTRVNRSAMYKWQIKLMSAIADANFCWHYVNEVSEPYQKRYGTDTFTAYRRVKRHVLLGTESNVKVAQMMYEYLAETIERILPYPNVERLSRSAISWREGCADRLVERIMAKYRDMRRKQGTEAQQSTALAIRDLDEVEYAANYDASYGVGAYARMKARTAEMAREQEEKREVLRQLHANETPEQRAKREAAEAKAAGKEAARAARYWEAQDRKAERDAARRDVSAYTRGHQKANDIGLSDQLDPSAAKDRRLG